jgi:hypothetical protein
VKENGFERFIKFLIMKTILYLIFAVVFNCSLNLSIVAGQAAATGHISAEVIDEVSAVSKTATAFNLKNKDIKAGIRQSGVQSLNLENLNLGSITINSAKEIVYDVILQPAKLSNARGKSFIIEPTVNMDSPSDLIPEERGRTLQINGKAQLLDKQSPGIYQGTYTIVLAFN